MSSGGEKGRGKKKDNKNKTEGPSLNWKLPLIGRLLFFFNQRPEDGAREPAGQREGRPGPGQSGSQGAAAGEAAGQNEQDAEAAAGQHQRPARPDTEGAVSSTAALSLRSRLSAENSKKTNHVSCVQGCRTSRGDTSTRPSSPSSTLAADDG